MIPIIALLPLFPWFLMIQKNLRLQYRDEGIRGSTLLKKAVHLFHSMHVTCAMRTGILRRSSSCLLPDALSSSADRNCFQPVAISLWWLWADYSIRSTHLLNSFYRIWNLADFVKLKPTPKDKSSFLQIKMMSIPQWSIPDKCAPVLLPSVLPHFLPVL